jgi:hypothetical protein
MHTVLPPRAEDPSEREREREEKKRATSRMCLREGKRKVLLGVRRIR